ncbi:MAG: ABC-2 type transporter [Pelotomaculum sp. PtaU1.Bin035]|nr:MAG: ABC-2 type transporter [Pelotomaculum sp. PtaU1.Bin035]
MSLAYANIGGALLVLSLSIISFAVPGLLAACFVLVYHRGNPVNWVLNSISWLLSGTLYPVSVLPGWLQNISVFLPLTHSLQAIRLTFLQGASIKDVACNLLALMVFSAVMLPAAVILFYIAIKKIRQEGSVSHY